MILHDPVSWPHDMSPPFKDFLQGLLTKDPRLRLQWPELLDHKFVAAGINGTAGLLSKFVVQFFEKEILES